MSEQTAQLYEFGPFRLDLTEQRLTRGGAVVPLTPKAFETLVALIEQEGHVVKKEQLMEQVWPGTFVEEGNLSVTIFMLRKALAEEEGGTKYIETVPKRGYRFVAPVRRVAHDAFAPRVGDQSPPDTTAERGVRAQASHGARPLPATTAQTMALSDSAQPSPVRRARAKAFDSLAVLPLLNGSDDPNTEYLSDGITESIINSLSQFPQLRVLARSTVFRYKGREVDPMEVGREMSVRAVLTGRVMQVGDQLIIRTELVDVADGWQLWGEQYNRQPADILAVQEEISREISAKLRLKLSG
ncbi:MAG: winged helix-turn-helix domain-containing protein, partial [Pyrinomonadaceae bacterium]|nr:winged helix-turn-helix domain-containing protein [Pyrinomonadaceae bacterium]